LEQLVLTIFFYLVHMIKDFTKKKYVHIANKNLEAKDGTTIIVPLSFWHILQKNKFIEL
jgi:hypothetical protein